MSGPRSRATPIRPNIQDPVIVRLELLARAANKSPMKIANAQTRPGVTALLKKA
ncbi:Uncharacterised protein [Mycobacteroides abscessus subsp. abscessus]|nr:Uncharacterised protein [Mycobacteroides abscessus subsp. abscessus]